MEEQPGERLVNTLEHDLSEASGTPKMNHWEMPQGMSQGTHWVTSQ